MKRDIYGQIKIMLFHESNFYTPPSQYINVPPIFFILVINSSVLFLYAGKFTVKDYHLKEGKVFPGLKYLHPT